MSGLKPIFYDDNSVQGTNWRKRSNYRYYRFFSLKPVISIFMWCDDSFVIFVLLSSCVFTHQFICSSKCTAQTDNVCILNLFVQIVILYLTLSLPCSFLIIKNKLFFFCPSVLSFSEMTRVFVALTSLEVKQTALLSKKTTTQKGGCVYLQASTSKKK